VLFELATLGLAHVKFMDGEDDDGALVVSRWVMLLLLRRRETETLVVRCTAVEHGFVEMEEKAVWSVLSGRCGRFEMRCRSNGLLSCLVVA
jgi:hypothetical protein